MRLAVCRGKTPSGGPPFAFSQSLGNSTSDSSSFNNSPLQSMHLCPANTVDLKRWSRQWDALQWAAYPHLWMAAGRWTPRPGDPPNWPHQSAPLTSCLCNVADIARDLTYLNLPVPVDIVGIQLVNVLIRLLAASIFL